MTYFSKYILFFLVVSSCIFTSCRKEETILVQPPEDETLAANSNISELIKKMVSNDGSIDNIIDNANCFNVQLPVSVLANTTSITVNSEEDYTAVEDVFDTLDDDDDTLEIIFPITIILEDYSQETIANYTELATYASNCTGENIEDDDIECVYFQYPISLSIFNSNNEIIEVVTVNNDKSFYEFLSEIAQYDIVSGNFPIIVKLASNGNSIEVQNFNQLQAILETNTFNCDEDDDYNYDDDDCNECTISQLEAYLTSCQDWEVDQLIRDNSTNTEEYYNGYVFNFYPDGSLISTYLSFSFSGTWTASGSGNNITVNIDIPTLPECNNPWILHEIEENPDGTKVDFRLGDEQIRYVNECIQ